MSVYPNNCSPVRKLFLDYWRYQLVGWYRENDNMNTAAENLNEILISKVSPKPIENVLYYSCGFGEGSTRCANLTGANVDQVYKNTWRAVRAQDINLNSKVNYFKSYLIDLPSNHYDCVIVNESISDFKDELAQIYRVLKPNGRFALSPLTVINLDKEVKWLIGEYHLSDPTFIIKETEQLFDVHEVVEFNESCFNTYNELATIFSTIDTEAGRYCYDNFIQRCELVSKGVWGKMLLTGIKK
ncbi:MAG: methyltransferase domain-containing protein [Richelia sp. RM2_1_2]|nr:methyltransferase domain-containing protein [Richelia sp. RM2_1_2]